jgi:hypothetical protein
MKTTYLTKPKVARPIEHIGYVRKASDVEAYFSTEEIAAMDTVVEACERVFATVVPRKDAPVDVGAALTTLWDLFSAAFVVGAPAAPARRRRSRASA